jgi:1,4-dihydroxy-2-naphthoyl-CoA hydrolase
VSSIPSVDGVPDLAEVSEFLDASGLRLTEVTSTRVVGVIDLGPEHHTPYGIVHGGVYCSAVETAASVGASAAAAERGQIAVGVVNTTNFLRPLTAGRVTVTATAVQQGRTQQLWQVDVVDGAGRLVATGQLRLQNVERPT